MIKFNTKSWHYRMHRFGTNRWIGDTMSFCPYARGVVRGLFWFSLMWTVVLATVIWNCMGLIFLSQGIWDYHGSVASAVNVFTAIILGAIGLVLAFCLSIQRYSEWSRRKQLAQGSEPGPRKPDSFVVTWFKNLHSKVCPTIEFTDQ